MKLITSIFNSIWTNAEIAIALLFVFIYGLGHFYYSHVIVPTIYLLVTFFLIFVSVVLFKQHILVLLSFLIPLTIPFDIGGGTTINFPSEFICIVLAIYFLIKIFVNYQFEKSLLFNAITLFILLDICWLILTSCTSSLPIVSFKRVLVRATYIIVYFFMIYELYKSNKLNINKVFFVHSLALLVPIIYTIIKHSYFHFSSKGAATAGLPFYNDHTLYGAVLAFFIPYLFYQSFIFKNRLLLQVVFISLFCIFLVALFLSYSRAAWATVLITAVIYILLRLKVKKRFVFFSLVVLVGIGITSKDTISNYLVKNREISHKNDVGQHFKSIANVQTDVSNAERVNRWKCAYRMFLDKPLFGFGPGTYQFNYGKYQQRKDLTIISTFSGNKGHAHSEYLNYLSETGLPGLVIFLFFVGAVVYASLKLIYHSEDRFIRDSATFLFLGLCTFFVHSIFNGFIETDKMAMPVFGSISAIVFLSILNGKQEKASA